MQGGGEQLSPAGATGNTMYVVPAASGSDAWFARAVRAAAADGRSQSRAHVERAHRFQPVRGMEQDFFPFAGQACGPG